MLMNAIFKQVLKPLFRPLFRPLSRPIVTSAVLGVLLTGLQGCSSGDQASSVGSAEQAAGISCDGSCADATSFLTVADVQTVIAQAVAEATALGEKATIAVVDRVGNVLGVFRMNGADTSVTISSGTGAVGGLEGIAVIPDTLAAISKAITGAYLSSEGNAFSTRTASQIIQQNFNPGETGQPSGPLFGVQFSNLPCSDLNTRFTTGVGAGPHRTPLGLAADLGGFPLYKNGTPVGGIGVIADGVYGVDLSITDRDRNVDELIAVAGSFNFAAPLDRRERITLDGKVARFSDVWFEDLASTPATAPTFASINGTAGSLQKVTAYTDGAILAGTAFGQPASGIKPDSTNFAASLDAFVLVDDSGSERFPPKASTIANGLTKAEVTQLISSAIGVANRSRAQIRRPTGSQMRVTVSIVDTTGTVLGIARTRDGPIFGTDVSLQKARTAAFYSGPNAAADLRSAPNTIYLNSDATPSGKEIVIADYVNNAIAFLGLPGALSDGGIAFADRSGGNLSRPFYPDGLQGSPPGPFSKPQGEWSVFSDGLQLDLVMNQVIQHVLHVATAGSPAPQPDTPQNCTNIARLPNGIQVFPGSVPIYRHLANGTVKLIGGIGVSGDGVDQDDMTSFLGLYEAGVALNGAIGHAPATMRADTLTPKGVRLRYVQCPQSPFLNSSETNVCSGK